MSGPPLPRRAQTSIRPDVAPVVLRHEGAAMAGVANPVDAAMVSLRALAAALGRAAARECLAELEADATNPTGVRTP